MGKKLLFLLLIFSINLFAEGTDDTSDLPGNARRCYKNIDEKSSEKNAKYYFTEITDDYNDLKNSVNSSLGFDVTRAEEEYKKLEGFYYENIESKEPRVFSDSTKPTDFCNSYADTKFHIANYEKALRKAKRRGEFDSGETSFNAADLGDGLYEMTASMLSTANIDQEILYSGDHNDAELFKVMDELIKTQQVNKESSLFDGLVSADKCTDSSQIYSGDSQNGFLSDFSSGFESNLLSIINIDKFRKDYINSYCFPVLKLYQACEENRDSLKEFYTENGYQACRDVTIDSLKSCMSGDFENTYILKSSSANEYTVGEDELADFLALSCESTCEKPEGKSKEQIQDELKSKLVSYAGVNKKGETVGKYQFIEKIRENTNSAKSQEYSQALLSKGKTGLYARFHSLYAVCTTYREAAKYVSSKGVTKADAESIGCRMPQKWTGDVKECMNGIIAIQSVNQFGGALEQTTLGIKSSVNQANLQKEYSTALANGDQTAGITAQEKTLKNARDNSLISSGTKTAQASTFAGLSSSFPSVKKLSQSCHNGDKAIYGNHSLDCGVFYFSQAGNNGGLAQLFPNDHVHNALISEAGRNSGIALQEAIKAAIYNNQAGKIGDIKKEYEKFYNDEYKPPQIVDVDFCSKNPSAQGCSTSNMQMIEGGNSFGDIGFQNEGAGNMGFTMEENLDEQEAMTPEQKRAVSELGNFMNRDKGDRLAGFSGAPAAAKAKAGGPGGGGGNAGGAGGGGGGGGGSGGKKGAPANSQASFKSKTPSWTSGTSGSGYKSGKGSDSKKSNPFGDIFNAQKGRVVASGENDISSKSSQLFEKISKRYSLLNDAKRLE